jgi:hypothetical protein
LEKKKRYTPREGMGVYYFGSLTWIEAEKFLTFFLLIKEKEID